MVVGFLLMLAGLVLIGLARSTKDEDQPRFTGIARKGLFGGGGVFMLVGLIFCVGRMIEWVDAVSSL